MTETKPLTWHGEKRKVSDLKPAPYNPRKSSKEEWAQLEESLGKFNLADPFIINTNNSVIGGHFRLKVLKKKGIETVDVRVPNRLLNTQEEKELNLRLNRNNGSWDEELLAKFEKELLEGVGFDEKEIARIFDFENPGLKDPDATPLPPEIAKTQMGDCYLLGKHRLLCGDATKIQDVERLMKNEMADLIVTDPPYNVNYQGGTPKALTIKNDNMKQEAFYQFLRDAFTSYSKSIKSGGVCYVFHADTEGLNFRNAFVDSGFLLKQVCIWVKSSHVMGRQDYHWQHEPILYGWLKGGSHQWYANRKQSTTWTFDKPSLNKDHPTSKPIDLIQYPIKNSSKSGDLIIDFFMGSGSTLIASERTGRKCYGLELDPKYCDVIVQRWEEYTGEKAKLEKPAHGTS